MAFVGYSKPLGFRFIDPYGVTTRVHESRHAKFSDNDFSTARLLKEELEQAELGDEDEDFMGHVSAFATQ